MREPNSTMKAVVIDQFGGAEQLRLTEVPTPIPKSNEVLVEVAYAGVNPVDWKIRQGNLKDRLPHEFPLILGWDFSGLVVKVGSDVRDFKPGDEVFSYARKPVVQWGTYAEYVSIDEKAVAPIPESLTLAEAASFPLVGLTAWQALFDLGKLTAGQTVLIHAGAGGVGGMALQFAKAVGAKAITTAAKTNHGYVRELGAEKAIDYNEEPFAAAVKIAAPGGVDLVFDTVGSATLRESYSLVKRGGRLISIAEPPDDLRAKELGISVAYHFVNPSGSELREISKLVDRGEVRPLAIEVLPLESVGLAHERSQSRHQRGKLVLKVAGN